jgi:uncharacterized protein with von Willebrand factor type A (vWA) domain
MHIRASPKLRKIAEMLGRFKRLALTVQKAKLTNGSEEIYDITLGDDLARLVPAERSKLLDSRTKKDFMRKFAEKSLMQYALKGRMPAGRGPVVVCLDSSGSIEETQDIWQKAVTLATLDIAQRQKRAFACILFGGIDDPLDITIVEAQDPEISKKAIHIADSFFGYHGTSFEKPLDAAVQIINTKEFSKADILFCTDGFCDVKPKWLEDFLKWKNEKDVRIQSVVLDNGSYTDSTLHKFSNEILSVSNIDDIELTQEIFSGF